MLKTEWKRHLWEWTSLAIILSLYFYLALRQWEAPGFICDWLYSEQIALDITARLEKGMSPWAVFLEGNRRVDSYHGTLTGTILAPLFILFGPSWFLARFFPVAFGALTLLLTYGFCRKVFGFSTALLAIFLIAIHTPFLLGTKLGDWFVNHAQAFSMGTLLLLAYWRSSKNPVYLAAGMAVMGLGFGTRMWYAWFPAALLAYGIIFSTQFLRQSSKTFPWSFILKTLLIGGAGFFVGHWLGSRDPTASASNSYVYKAVLDCFSPDNPSGIFHYRETFGKTFRLFNSMMNGAFFQDLLAAGNYHFLNEMAPIIFWGMLFLSAMILVPRQGNDRARWGFVASVFLLMFFISPLNTRGHDIHVEPLFFLYPFPQILEAAGFILLWKTKLSRSWRFLLVALLALLVGSEVRSVVKADTFLKETGGRRHYSGAIYDLADWVKDQRAAGGEFLVFYYNLSAHLHLLTSDPYFRLSAPGTRQSNHLFFSYDFAGQTGEKCWIVQNGDPVWFSDMCAQVLPRIDRELFVIESVFTNMSNHFAEFTGQARLNGFDLTLLKQFSDDDGAAVFKIHRLKRIAVQ